jgi:hypothetical protein
MDGAGRGLSVVPEVTWIFLYRLGGVDRWCVAQSSIASWIGASSFDILVCHTELLTSPSPTPTLIGGSVVKIGFLLFLGFFNGIVVCCPCLVCGGRRVLGALCPYLECHGVGYHFDDVVLVGWGFCFGCLYRRSPPRVVVGRVLGWLPPADR